MSSSNVGFFSCSHSGSCSRVTSAQRPFPCPRRNRHGKNILFCGSLNECETPQYVDATDFIITTGLDGTEVSGQLIIPDVYYPVGSVFQVGPSLTLNAERDISEDYGAPPVTAEFAGTIRFALIPQDLGDIITPVPEPSTALLQGAALLGLMGLATRRRTN